MPGRCRSASRHGWIAAGAGTLLAALLVPSGTVLAQEEGFDLGGAARFDYGWRDYGADKGSGDPDLELLRIDASGRRGGAIFSLQYRWYQDFDAIHHAWAGWRWDEGRDVRAGIVQVPFGLLPYASQSFWFGSGYYLGLEDDYDMGAVYRHVDDDRQWHVGLFLADEYDDGGRYARYSFDVATTPALPYRERERLNLRHARTRGAWEWGLSAYLGRVEDVRRRDRHGMAGLAGHVQWQEGPWTLQGQWTRYRYDVPGDRIAMSAFLFPFEIAAQADVLTANIAWAAPEPGVFDGITCYNNLSTTRASGPGLGDSWQNVTGCSFAKGRMFTYVDWIAGYNMWFIGGPGIGLHAGAEEGWNSRLNINVGFYF